MKILMVSHIVTHPHDMGNRQRIFRECEYLKRIGCEVDFLFLRENTQISTEEMRKYFGQSRFYEVLADETDVKTKIKGYIRNWMNRKKLSKYIALKYNADELFTDKTGKRVQELHERNQYDVIWVQYTRNSKVFDFIDDSNVLKVIDTHDKWTDRNRMYQKKNLIPEGYYITKKEERKALNRSDVIVAIQDKEAVYFDSLLNHKKTVVTIGDLVECYECEIGEEYSYGFIGANNRPNIEGAKWFCEKVLPVVREKCPESRFYMAGDVCKLVPDYEGCIKLGRVDSLQDFYGKVKVVINPIQMGTGLNIKSIEALSYGKPFVTTSVGCKGLESEVEIYKCADEAESFAEEIVSLLQNENLCQQLQERAQGFISEYNRKNFEVINDILLGRRG